MSDQLFNADTETAILSIILKSPEKIFELNSIKEFMFSSGANQLLFATINSLANQGLSPEITLIHDSLKAKNKDLQVGGKEYLSF
jgi:replicative DNA helicase